jgi:hypothetical protein
LPVQDEVENTRYHLGTSTCSMTADADEGFWLHRFWRLWDYRCQMHCRTGRHFFVAVSLQAINCIQIPEQSRLPASGKQWETRAMKHCFESLDFDQRFRDCYQTARYGRGSKCKAPIHTWTHRRSIAPIHPHDPYIASGYDPYPLFIHKRKWQVVLVAISGHLSIYLCNMCGSNLLYIPHSFHTSGSLRNDSCPFFEPFPWTHNVNCASMVP